MGNTNEKEDMRYAITLYILVSSLLYGGESTYRLGSGIQVGSLPLYAGGYISLAYESKVDEVSELAIDDMALMLYGEEDRVSYLVEMESEDVYRHSDTISTNTILHIERLYLGYEFDDMYDIKIGKYNSAIGFWNINPINVLRDTTSSPIITDIIFPKFTNGLEVNYHSQGDKEYQISMVIQENRDIDTLMHDDIYNNFNIDRYYGIGVYLQDESWSYRFNGGYFETLDDLSLLYMVAAFSYSDDKSKLIGEIGMQFGEDGIKIPYAGYLQYSYALDQKHEAILRVESYRDLEREKRDSFIVAGYTYRPMAPIALKGEYQWHTIERENRFLISASILF